MKDLCLTSRNPNRRFAFERVVAFVLLFVSAGVHANAFASQSTSARVQTRGSVFESVCTRYRFERDGTGYKEVSARIRILDKSGVRQWLQLTFDYKPFYEQLDIRYIRVAKKQGAIVGIALNIIKQSNQREDQKEYYDEARFKLPPLSPGDVINYSIRTNFVRPIAYHQFWVQHTFLHRGAIAQSLEIDISKAQTVKIRTGFGCRVWESEKGGRRSYHWRPDAYQMRNRYDPVVGDVLASDVELTTFTTWEEVGHWYSGIERPHRVPSPDVRAKAKQLTNGIADNLAKVEALYNFTAQNVKYINLMSLGVSGYEPHSAVETLKRGFGDCKDKAALLIALLDAIGLDASSALVNSSYNIGHEIPSPAAFNHVLIVTVVRRRQIWMDASLSGIPFGMLPRSVQDKPALVTELNGIARFEITPGGSAVSTP